MDQSSALFEFEKVAGTLFNPYIEEWKKQGKKVFGYNCSYFPEEIALAAGLLPFRIRGTGCQDTTQADAFLSRVNCSAVRAGLEHLLQGNYDFLDGAAWVYSCDHMCTAHNSWKAQNKIPLIENIISVPHTITEYGHKWYREEIENIMAQIESHLGVTISDDQLREAIAACNETGRLQKKFYELRQKKAPPLTGGQSLNVLIANGSMPKEDYNRMLQTAIEELEGSDPLPGYDYRVMVAGSMVDDPALLNMIEDAGAMVVTDTLCFGARRSFQDAVAEDGDPLEAIVERYYKQILCPRMFEEYPQRLEFTLNTAKEANVDGIVLQSIKNCDLHGIDSVMLERDFEKNGIPVLMLEREHNVLPDAGRFKTRIQAFLEQIGRSS
jgi:bzd-type benzoyl-CoA reductase N subunit